MLKKIFQIVFYLLLLFCIAVFIFDPSQSFEWHMGGLLIYISPFLLIALAGYVNCVQKTLSNFLFAFLSSVVVIMPSLFFSLLSDCSGMECIGARFIIPLLLFGLGVVNFFVQLLIAHVNNRSKKIKADRILPREINTEIQK